MVSYLFKTLILTVFSFVVIYFYYFSSSIHIENFNGYLPYLLVVGIIYSIYKYFQFESSEKKASLSLIKILGFFLLHLLILCILFFAYNKLGLGNGLELFFKIVYFSVLPILIVLISLSFGKKVTSYLPSIKNESVIYTFLISLGVGFFSFVFLLDIIGILGFYNLYIVFLILAGFIAYSYKELISIFKGIIDYKFEVDIEEGNYLKLISTEFLFIVSTLVLCVSLISVFRPFPIGWDDLGVYMNYPHLMAEAGSIIALGQMYAWQTFTGIGYMFGSPTQAFYFNVVGGFLSFIALTLIVSDLFKSTSDSKIKTFINIPLLIGTIFISMPMIVFQQAKDMKLDAGLFFISIIPLYLIYKYYLKLDNKTYLEKVKSFVNDKVLHRSFNISNLLIILIIGLLAGFAFAIKFTSLLLISSIIGVIFFARLGFLGFAGYLGIFFAVFTKANLWGMMNVVVNPNQIAGFETKFALISGTIGILLLAYTFVKKTEIVKKLLLEVGIFLLGVLIALLPWISKNIVESYPNISVGSIIGGTQEHFNFDKTLIYSEEELNKINKNIETRNNENKQESKCPSTNEDLCRYFGYEKGINGYIKLPWNLTMQLNQAGEYTDIGYIFLALIPVILLFLPFRRKEYAYLIVLFLILELFIFVKADSNKLIENNSLSGISETTRSLIFTQNESVFQKSSFGKDIYDIDVNDYISRDDINKLLTGALTFEAVNTKAKELFYNELKTLVINKDLGPNLVLIGNPLSSDDFELIKDLRILHDNYSTFNNDISSVVALEKVISSNKLEQEKDILIGIWKDNRNMNQVFSDFLSTFNLPFGYGIVLLIFFLPVLFFLFTLDEKNKNEHKMISLFKYNLIFASFYTFLWTISAFGIVWYGITMYFSFLLIIAIGMFYLTSYSDDDSEKDFYIKGFGTLALALIILIYFVNSVFPHSFTNLKGAGYDQYKMGQINKDEAPFLYHSEYLKILFTLNIAEDKREDFLKEFITDDIQEAIDGVEKMDIHDLSLILKEINQKHATLNMSAKKSLNNIYKNVTNPPEKYKNKVGIYRVGTFLKYHISENQKRLLEDSLLFNFNDYIYNSNTDKTIDNFKKLGLGYLLVDLNAATIDQDERHNLTNRYEKLLSTFVSDKLELVETDSICLKIALEDYNKSEKTQADMERFITISGVNYESYTADGKKINRGTKLLECYNVVNDLINDKKIDENNYAYLLNLNNYISQNIDKFKTQNELYTLLQQQISHGYKVLFKVK